MSQTVFLLISKLDGPPSTFVPPSAVENRELPSKRYVISKYARKLSSNSRIDSPTIEIIGNDITRLRVSIDLWGKLGIRHTGIKIAVAKTEPSGTAN